MVAAAGCPCCASLRASGILGAMIVRRIIHWHPPLTRLAGFTDRFGPAPSPWGGRAPTLGRLEAGPAAEPPLAGSRQRRTRRVALDPPTQRVDSTRFDSTRLNSNRPDSVGLESSGLAYIRFVHSDSHIASWDLNVQWLVTLSGCDVARFESDLFTGLYYIRSDSTIVYNGSD